MNNKNVIKDVIKAVHATIEQIEEWKKILEKATVNGMPLPAFTEEERRKRYEDEDKGKYTFIVDTTLEIIPGETYIIRAEFDDIESAIDKIRPDLMTIAHLSLNSVVQIRLQPRV